MRAELRGLEHKAAIAVVGAWEPLGVSHLRLFRRLARRARRQGQSSCVVVIHPPPAHLLHRPGRRLQEYDDLDSRLSLIESCSVDSIVIAHFEVADLQGSAERFLRLVNECVDLRELWLGATQSLGVGSEGSMNTVERLSDSLGFKLVVMPPHREAINAGRVWKGLAAGKIEAVTELVGHAPIRSRPSSGWLPLSWPSGTYPAAPLAKPIAVFSRVPDDRINVEVIGNAASRGMIWPAKDVQWLAFVGDPILPRERTAGRSTGVTPRSRPSREERTLSPTPEASSD